LTDSTFLAHLLDRAERGEVFPRDPFNHKVAALRLTSQTGCRYAPHRERELGRGREPQRSVAIDSLKGLIGERGRRRLPYLGFHCAFLSLPAFASVFPNNRAIASSYRF
jgi:hypothetical protein